MTKDQALINILAQQRNDALNSLAMTAAELTVLQEKLKELESKGDTPNPG